MTTTKQINLRLPVDVIAMYQEMADAADDRDRSYFMKKALLGYVSGTKIKKAVPAKAPAKRFAAPCYEQAANYFYEKGSKSCRDDARAFIDFYESKGWYVGKSKMKDWQAAARNWIKRSRERASHDKSKQSLSQRSQSATERALAQIEVGCDLLGSNDAALRLQMD